MDYDPRTGNGTRERPGEGRFRGSNGSPEPGPHPLEPLLKHLAELRVYAAQYLAAQGDRWKVQLRNTGLQAVLGLAGLLTGAVALATAVVLLLLGAAGGLASVLGDRAWAGQLIVGGGVLLLAGLMVLLGIKVITSSSRRRTIEKYERRENQQRANLGQSVSQRAQGSDV